MGAADEGTTVCKTISDVRAVCATSYVPVDSTCVDVEWMRHWARPKQR